MSLRAKRSEHNQGGLKVRRLIHISVFIALAAMLSLAGCGPKVMVPPNVDLAVFNSIALIDFTSNAEGNLADYATQRFVEIVTASQPSARIIEVGTEEEVLVSVGADKMDLEAVKAIGEVYDVEAIVTGTLDVSDVKPRVRLSMDIAALGVEADIEASLTSKLFDTYDGATLWTASSRGRETVAHVSVFADGGFSFDADDPKAAYGGLIEGLVSEVTYDLRVRYERQ
jgi:hypothetical protein